MKGTKKLYMVIATLAMPLAAISIPVNTPGFVKTFEADGPLSVSTKLSDGRNVLEIRNDGFTEVVLKATFADGVKRIDRIGRVKDTSCYTGEFWIGPGETERFFQGDAAESPLPPISKMPLFAWGWPFSVSDALSGRYMEVRECGCNLLIQSVKTEEQARKCLDAAVAAGIRLVLHWGEPRKNPQALLPIMDHPGLAAHYLWDEPNIKKMPEIGAIARNISSVDHTHPLYMNWFGILEHDLEKWYGTTSYVEYLEPSIKEIKTDLYSLDVYPVYAPRYAKRPFFFRGEDIHLRKNWYQSLELVSSLSRRENKPFWAFANVVPLRCHKVWDNPIPTLGHLKLMQYSNLAYGAQGLQYYSFRPNDDGGMCIDVAPLSPDGRRTPMYDRMALANREFAARAHVFLGGKVKVVRHTGWKVPQGTTALAVGDLPPFVKEFDPCASDLVVSVQENDGSGIFMVLNRDPIHGASFKASFKDGTMRVDASGAESAAHNGMYGLAVGDAEIFMFKSKGE